MRLLDSTVAIDHLRGDLAAVDLLRELVENDETLAASEIARVDLLTTTVRHCPMLPGLELRTESRLHKADRQRDASFSASPTIVCQPIRVGRSRRLARAAVCSLQSR